MKRKIWSALLAFVIAFGLWLYVITYVSPGSEETYYNIPVIFEGETALSERNLMITSGDTASVTLKISGNRSDLNKINESNIKIKVDLSKVYDPGERELSYSSITFPGDVPQSAFVVESKTPETVKINVEKIQRKEVPVMEEFSGSAPEGYIAYTSEAVLDYPSINVTGPSSVVELIDHARIDVDLTDRSESISENYRYTLCDADGNPIDVEQVTTDVAEVHLDVKIQRWKQIDLKLNVTYGGGATEENTKISILPATVRVSGSDAMLEDLNEIVLGSVDLSTLENDTQMSFAINLPEGVTNLSNVTDAAVDISFKGLTIKKFMVSQIRAVNVPDGLECDLLNEVLEVTLRGPTAQISQLTPEDIIVTVDLTGKEIGTSTVKAMITIQGEQFARIGEMGTHSVSVTLREPEKR